jgi:hypothetical protein
MVINIKKILINGFLSLINVEKLKYSESMDTYTNVICNMENHVEKNEVAMNLMPKFLSYEYVLQNIKNIKHDFEFVQLSKDQIKELEANVDKEFLSPESIQLLSSEYNQVPVEYGSWMYFPIRNKCIQILPKTDFIELRTCRNRLKINRNEQLDLSKKSIAVIGLSAGNAVVNALIAERICGRIILFDFDNCELSNLNRLNAGIFDLGLNKCIISANSILEKDPYIDVEIHVSGFINSKEHADIIESVDLVVDECDSFDIKIVLRELSRKFRKPLLMHTSERGITDIERYDLIKDLPIFHGLLNGVDLSDKSKVLMAIINPQIVSERMLHSFSELGKSLKSWPQLATEVFSGGANLAGIARMILLDQKVVGGRYFFNTEEVGG